MNDRPRRFVARQSKSFIERARNRNIFLWCTIVVAFGSWIFTFSKLSELSIFNIDVIQVSGAGEDIIPDVRAAALDSIDGKYFHLFSRSNVFLYPRGEVKKAVLASSPRIEEVGVKHDKLNGIILSVTEKVGDALVCTTFPEFIEGNINLDESRCLLADKKGFLYAHASTTVDNGYNLYFVPILGERATTSMSAIGIYATSTSEFNTVQRFYSGLKKNGINVKAILFKEKGEYEAYISTEKSDKVSVVYFNNERPLSVQFDNLVLFWNRILEDSKKGKQVPAFEYIDVRYGPNVFYR